MTKKEVKQWIRERVKQRVRNYIKENPFPPEAVEKWGSKLIKRELNSYRKLYTYTYEGNGNYVPCYCNGEPVKL